MHESVLYARNDQSIDVSSLKSLIFFGSIVKAMIMQNANAPETSQKVHVPRVQRLLRKTVKNTARTIAKNISAMRVYSLREATCLIICIGVEVANFIFLTERYRSRYTIAATAMNIPRNPFIATGNTLSSVPLSQRMINTTASTPQLRMPLRYCLAMRDCADVHVSMLKLIGSLFF